MLRRITMLLSLGIFAVLLVTGKLQVWMLIMLASILLALLLGRFYCGWICPINTFIEAGSWIKTKLGIKNRTPKILQSKVWGLVLLALLVSGLIISRVAGRNIPLLLFMIPLGLVISLTFSPSSWHHWMCPYNILFRMTGGKSLLFMSINTQKCIGCAKCSEVCPAAAIGIDNGKASIEKSACLLCTKCQKVCPMEAIPYGKPTQTFPEKQAG